jgi:hypothetical protein
MADVANLRFGHYGELQEQGHWNGVHSVGDLREQGSSETYASGGLGAADQSERGSGVPAQATVQDPRARKYRIDNVITPHRRCRIKEVREGYMAQFNIVHVNLKYTLNVRAYHEVIESVRWGLQQLGHDTTYRVNAFCPNSRNILFGGHLSPELIINSPDDTILYNLEQIRGNPHYDPGAPNLLVRLIASKLHVWDYSGGNLDTWNRLCPKWPVRHVPISYAPILTRIEPAEQQDIDVLIYGSVGERRLAAFAVLSKLVNIGLSTVFACGLFGADRDSLIARSKIVLNVNHLVSGKIFEIVRVSYLMANAKAIVADFSPDSYIESDIVDGVMFAPIERIAETCYQLSKDQDCRIRLERVAFACFARRDIQAFLSSALDV